MSAHFAWVRGKLLVPAMVTSACSLFAPTDDEIAGGKTAGSGGVGTNGGATSQAGGRDSAGSSSGGAGTATGGTPADGGVSQGGAPDAGAGGDAAGAGMTGSGGSASGGRASGGSANGGAMSGGSASGGTVSGGAPNGGNPATGGAATCTPDVTSTRPKASTLLDDFSNGNAGPGFFVNGSPSTCATESSGNVVVTLPNPVPASEYCYYQTSVTYDLTCDSVVLKVSQVARSVIGLQTFLYAFPDDSHKLFVVVENGSYLLGSVGGDDSSGGRYDPANPWWRLREAVVKNARMVIFETSPDGADWTERARLARPFALNNVRIAFGTGAYQTTSSPGSGTFACYNGPPSCR